MTKETQILRGRIARLRRDISRAKRQITLQNRRAALIVEWACEHEPREVQIHARSAHHAAVANHYEQAA